MQPIRGGGQSKWAQHVANLLWRLAGVAQEFLGPDHWEGVFEGALEFIGVRPLTQSQAHLLSTMMRKELADLIEACRTHMSMVGGNVVQRVFKHHVYVDCRRVTIALQSTLGALAHLETVLDYYIQMTREAHSPSTSSTGAAALPAGAGVPPGVQQILGQTPLTSWPISPQNCRKVAAKLSEINFHTWRMARHMQASITGPQEDNPYVVTGSFFALHLLVRSMQQSLHNLQKEL